jgi:hypothetical protein
MEGFQVVHHTDSEVHVLHSPTSKIFCFAVQDGALAPSPGLVPPIPIEAEAEAHLSGARRTAIAFLMKRRGQE